MKKCPHCKRRPLPQPHRHSSGMTLIEVCTGLFLFTLVAGGLLGSLIFARRMSIAALYESCALASAEGYIEQMKALGYETLKDCCTAGATIRTVAGNGAADPLKTSATMADAAPTENTRYIDVFGHYNLQTPPAGAKDIMKMTYVVKVTKISSLLYDERVLIQLKYTWDSGSSLGISTTRTHQLSLVSNNVAAIVN